MKLNFDTYKDKVYACWLGKNIGGTIGTPYEGCREKLSITGFSTPPNEPLPNDDLDLQLLWLHAVHSEGARNFTSEKLGEYWLSFVIQHWNEYGISQQHMRTGLYPNVAGDYANPWKHSNGAWIRTEIWATLAPACPDIAVRFAMEDAKIDHGLGEGTYAAAFVAALESAAFVVSDVRKLIEIGLSKIPADCRIAKTVKLVVRSFDEGKTADETRDLVLAENADIGDGWFQAPSNVGYVILGLIYGGGDFKKSLLLAVNCGDDTDCTAATIGSIMGIIYGTKGVPADWVEYVSDKIITMTIARTFPVPKTCKELTEKVVDFAPAFLIENDAPVRIVQGAEEIEENISETFMEEANIVWSRTDDYARAYYINQKENAFSVRGTTFTALISYEGDPTIAAGEEKKLTVQFLNNAHTHGNRPRNVCVKVLDLPDGFSVDKPSFSSYVPQFTTLTREWIGEPVTVTVKAGAVVQQTNRILFEMYEDGHYTRAYAPIIFIGA